MDDGEVAGTGAEQTVALLLAVKLQGRHPARRWRCRRRPGKFVVHFRLAAAMFVVESRPFQDGAAAILPAG